MQGVLGPIQLWKDSSPRSGLFSRPLLGQQFFSFLLFFQFSYSVMSDSMLPHEVQHARLPCPSPPTPGVCSSSCPLSRWCHPTISSSVDPFSSRLQSFPASGSFLMSQFFVSGGQSIGASASVLPMNIQEDNFESWLKKIRWSFTIWPSPGCKFQNSKHIQPVTPGSKLTVLNCS